MLERSYSLLICTDLVQGHFRLLAIKKLLNLAHVLVNFRLPNNILFLKQRLEAEDHILNLRDEIQVDFHGSISHVEP